MFRFLLVFSFRWINLIVFKIIKILFGILSSFGNDYNGYGVGMLKM